MFMENSGMTFKHTVYFCRKMKHCLLRRGFPQNDFTQTVQFSFERKAALIVASRCVKGIYNFNDRAFTRRQKKCHHLFLHDTEELSHSGHRRHQDMDFETE